MTEKLNRCAFQTASAGTGDFVYASTLPTFLSPIDAKAIDGKPYANIAENGSPPTEWEISIGNYNEGTNSILRSIVVESSNGGLVVDFTDPPYVRMGVPLAFDFRAPINVAVNVVTPVTFDIHGESTLVLITTDGSGSAGQAITVPDLTEADAGAEVTFQVVAVGDPGDSVELQFSDVEPSINWELGLSDYVSVRWGGTGWYMVDGALPTAELYVRMIKDGSPTWELFGDIFTSVPQSPWQVFASGADSEANFIARDPDETQTYEDVDTGTTDSLVSSRYSSFVADDGSIDLFLSDGLVTGQRKLIKFVFGTGVPTLNTGNIVSDDAGTVPTSIQFTVANSITGDELWLVWKKFVGVGGKWVILGSSTDVVTV